MIRRTSVIFCVLVGLASAFLAGACRKPPDAGALGERGRPVVAATIFPIGDIVRAIAGSAADVVVILPAGASPATFEPAPDVVRRLAGSRLIVAVGAGADDWGSGVANAMGGS
jgi:ABC-type Zn uptake system ZnuABC Zn-binding protein ZnuA